MPRRDRGQPIIILVRLSLPLCVICKAEASGEDLVARSLISFRSLVFSIFILQWKNPSFSHHLRHDDYFAGNYCSESQCDTYLRSVIVCPKSCGLAKKNDRLSTADIDSSIAELVRATLICRIGSEANNIYIGMAMTAHGQPSHSKLELLPKT
jgi:hypothetical protein